MTGLPVRFACALLAATVASGAAAEDDEAPLEVAVLSVSVVMTDDLSIFSSAASSLPPAMVKDGSLWLGPDAARAVRWGRGTEGVELDPGVEAYADIDLVILQTIERTGPTRSEILALVGLWSTLPPPPEGGPPEPLVFDITAPRLSLDVPVIWPEGIAWSVEGATLTVSVDGGQSVLYPGETLALPEVEASVPYVMLGYGEVSKGEDFVAPDIVELENGSLAVTCAIEITWLGRLPLEVVE